jgi:hypothetical protein
MAADVKKAIAEPWSNPWMDQIIGSQLADFATKLCDGGEFRLCGQDFQVFDYFKETMAQGPSGATFVEKFTPIFKRSCFPLLHRDALPILEKVTEAFRRGTNSFITTFRDWSNPKCHEIELLSRLFQGCGIQMQKYQNPKDRTTAEFQFSWKADNEFVKGWASKDTLKGKEEKKT